MTLHKTAHDTLDSQTKPNDMDTGQPMSSEFGHADTVITRKSANICYQMLSIYLSIYKVVQKIGTIFCTP